MRIAALTMISLACVLDARAEERETRELWLFFGPEGVEMNRLGVVLEKHPGVVLRPCILVSDWKAIAEPSDDLADTVKVLRSILGADWALALWDVEGLAFARAIGVDRLPAFVLVKNGRRAHVAYGAGADVEELLRCSKR